jgi:hypothetical protein
VTAPAPPADLPLVEPGPDPDKWDETPAQAATADRRRLDRPRRGPMNPNPREIAAQLVDRLGSNLAARLTTSEQQATAHRILQQLADREDPATARAWMIGMNPHLDDQAPILAIAEGRGQDAEAAARAYLNGVWT